MAATFLAGPRRHPDQTNALRRRKIMAVSTLRVRRGEARVLSVPALALAASDPSGGATLALDLGQKTGWAVQTADGALTSGTVEFKPSRWEGGGMVFLRFRAWLQEVDETAGGIGAVYFEEVRFHRGVTASHAYGGYLAHLTAWAEANKIPYRGVPVGTIKRHVTSKGNADKEVVGQVSPAQVREIAEQKMKDLDARNMDSACRIIEGTARSMGIEVNG
jgi:hypothetical protein